MTISNVLPTRNNLFKFFVRQYSVSNVEEIVVPKRIPRGPTDILKALASTIRRDPTAPHYKFHDDPYLIPTSNNAKRTFALSQEAGRKAAMWIKEEHAELFRTVTAEPPIEAFLPKPRYDEFDEIDDVTLLKTIQTASVTDSVALYDLMLKHNIPVSDESKLNLLELICFFNETEELAEDLIEERWYSQTKDSDKKVLRKTWKDNGLAAKLFSELPPSPRGYSVMIMGMVKYYQLEEADKLYQEALKKDFCLSVGAYNAILKCANFLQEGWSQRWHYIQNIFADMNEHGCKPTLSTLNRTLELFSRNPNVPDIKNLSLQMIAEVRRFEVEPSPGSYHYLLQIFCKSNREPSYILEDILDLVEGKELKAEDISDSLFFSTAMEKCRFYYKDTEIAYRVNRLLWHKNNYNLIGSSYKESGYYRNYFLLLCEGELLENIMDQYNFYVPNIYTPELVVLQEIIKVITMNGAVDLYLRIWTDMVLMDVSDKEQLVTTLLEGMVLNRPPPSDPPTETAIKLGEIAYSIFTKAETDTDLNKLFHLDWTNELLGNILLLCLCANNFSRATTVFQKMTKNAGKLPGIPCTESLEMMMDACIKNNQLKVAMLLLQYCNNIAVADDRKLAIKLLQNMHLGPAYLTHIVAMFGQSLVKEAEETVLK